MKTLVAKITASIIVLGALVCGAALGAVALNIRQTVNQNCQIAQEAYPHPGDDVAALVAFMTSTEHSLHDRNHKATWTLGRLRDPKARPALEAAYTGESCNHDNALCQYELEKAIRLCGGVPTPPRQRKH